MGSVSGRRNASKACGRLPPTEQVTPHQGGENDAGLIEVAVTELVTLASVEEATEPLEAPSSQDRIVEAARGDSQEGTSFWNGLQCPPHVGRIGWEDDPRRSSLLGSTHDSLRRWAHEGDRPLSRVGRFRSDGCSGNVVTDDVDGLPFEAQRAREWRQLAISKIHQDEFVAEQSPSPMGQRSAQGSLARARRGRQDDGAPATFKSPRVNDQKLVGVVRNAPVETPLEKRHRHPDRERFEGRPVVEEEQRLLTPPTAEPPRRSDPDMEIRETARVLDRVIGVQKGKAVDDVSNGCRQASHEGPCTEADGPRVEPLGEFLS